MKLREYHRPGNLDEALSLLRRPWIRSALLAGGTDLNGRDDAETEAVIDLRASLPAQRTTDEAGNLLLGAMLTLQQLADDLPLAELTGGLLARAALWSAPATIRRGATLGGSLASPRGGDDLPAVLLALGASVRLAGEHEGDWPLDEFLQRRAELLAGSVITDLLLPQPQGPGFGLARVSRSPADRSIVLAAAVQTGEQRRVVLGGVGPSPRFLPDEIQPDQVEGALAGWEVIADLRASAEYRRWVAPVLVRRALEQLRGGEPQ